MWGGGVSHPLQLTTGLVINSSVTTSPTLAGERMLLIPKVSILSEQLPFQHHIMWGRREGVLSVQVSILKFILVLK